MLEYKFTNIPDGKKVYHEYMTIWIEWTRSNTSMHVAQIIAGGGEWVLASKLGTQAFIGDIEIDKNVFDVDNIYFLVWDLDET